MTIDSSVQMANLLDDLCFDAAYITSCLAEQASGEAKGELDRLKARILASDIPAKQREYMGAELENAYEVLVISSGIGYPEKLIRAGINLWHVYVCLYKLKKKAMTLVVPELKEKLEE